MGEHNERGSEKKGGRVEKVKEREKEWTAALCPCGALQPTFFTGL